MPDLYTLPAVIGLRDADYGTARYPQSRSRFPPLGETNYGSTGKPTEPVGTPTTENPVVFRLRADPPRSGRRGRLQRFDTANRRAIKQIKSTEVDRVLGSNPFQRGGARPHPVEVFQQNTIWVINMSFFLKLRSLDG